MRIVEALDDFEVHDGGMPADVVEILAAAEVASARALTVGEPMLDWDSRTQPGASFFGRCHPTEALLEFLLLVDLHAAPALPWAVGATRAEFARRARHVVELDGATELVALELTSRARHRLVAEVEAKVPLREEPLVARRPGFADDRDALALEFRD